MSVAVNNETFESEVLNAQELVLAEFYSDTCIPCKRLSPILSKLESEYGDKLMMVKINIHFSLETAEKYDAAASPTIVFFKNGEEQDRIRGFVCEEIRHDFKADRLNIIRCSAAAFGYDNHIASTH